MKQLKERYIYDVVRRLPENQRAEVAKELEANIYDMMQEDSEEEMIRVIEILGEPRILASEYREKKRYLISPEWMDDYLRALKIVIAVAVSLAFVFGLMDQLLHFTESNALGIFAEVFAGTINAMGNAAVTAFTLVTLAFYLFERYNYYPFKKKWSVEVLPQLPKEDVLKLSRTGHIIGFIFTVVFSLVFGFVLLHHNEYFVLIYNTGGSNYIIEAVFESSAINAYFPFFVASMVVSIVVLAMKIVKGYLNLPIMAAHTFSKGLSLFAFLYFIHQTPLLRNDFITSLAGIIHVPSADIISGIDAFIQFATVFVTAIVALEITLLWVKYLRHRVSVSKEE